MRHQKRLMISIALFKMGLLIVRCHIILHTWSLKSKTTWNLGFHRWLGPHWTWFCFYTNVSVHGRPVDIKVGNHPHELSPCGKPIDCAHSAVLQSGDLLSFVERVVHVMQTEICLILQSHSPRWSSAWAFGSSNKGRAQPTCWQITICLLVRDYRLWEVQHANGAEGITLGFNVEAYI